MDPKLYDAESFLGADDSNRLCYNISLASIPRIRSLPSQNDHPKRGIRGFGSATLLGSVDDSDSFRVAVDVRSMAKHRRQR